MIQSRVVRDLKPFHLCRPGRIVTARTAFPFSKCDAESPTLKGERLFLPAQGFRRIIVIAHTLRKHNIPKP
jgi:hypothetical protein